MIDNSEENRLSIILEDYWNKLRGDRPYPSEDEFEPDEIKHVWDGCFLVNVHEGSLEDGYHFQYLGQHLIDAYGDDISNEEVNVLVAPTKQRMVEKIHEVAETGAPVHDDSEFINANSVHVRYRKVFLPLGHDGDVTHVIGGIRWKGY
jgi:hypothetical protein